MWKQLHKFCKFTFAEYSSQLFFLNIFGGHIHMSCFGATDTPVLDFWWRLIRIAEANVMYIPWDPPLVPHIADLLMVSIVGRWQGSYLAQEYYWHQWGSNPRSRDLRANHSATRPGLLFTTWSAATNIWEITTSNGDACIMKKITQFGNIPNWANIIIFEKNIEKKKNCWIYELILKVVVCDLCLLHNSAKYTCQQVRDLMTLQQSVKVTQGHDGWKWTTFSNFYSVWFMM